MIFEFCERYLIFFCEERGRKRGRGERSDLGREEKERRSRGGRVWNALSPRKEDRC